MEDQNESKEKKEEKRLQKELDKKANNKFLDKVIIWMLSTVFFFVLFWTILNILNIQVQSEIIVGYISFFSLEGGISAIITIKKNKKKQEEDMYNNMYGGTGYNDMNYGYQPEPRERHYQDEEEIYDEPENPEDEGEIK